MSHVSKEISKKVVIKLKFISFLKKTINILEKNFPLLNYFMFSFRVHKFSLAVISVV